MKKFNSIVFERLSLQAEEAKDQGLLKLANGIESAISSGKEDIVSEYSSDEMHDDIYRDLWAAAANVIKYYNVNNVDVETVDEFVDDMTRVVVASVVEALGISDDIGPREPKLPGEK